MTHAAWAAGVAALATFLVAGPAAAQATDGRQPPPTVNEKDFVVKPPGRVDPALVKPAPPGRDPGLVERPPADARDAAPDSPSEKPRTVPPGRSRQDDCRGATEDCRQSSPR